MAYWRKLGGDVVCTHIRLDHDEGSLSRRAIFLRLSRKRICLPAERSGYISIVVLCLGAGINPCRQRQIQIEAIVGQKSHLVVGALNIRDVQIGWLQPWNNSLRFAKGAVDVDVPLHLLIDLQDAFVDQVLLSALHHGVIVAFLHFAVVKHLFHTMVIVVQCLVLGRLQEAH